MKKYLALLMTCALCLTACSVVCETGEGAAPQPGGVVETQQKEPSIPETVQPAKPETVDLSNLESPPALTVTCGGEEVVVLEGTFTWSIPQPDGTTMTICADAMHPTQCRAYLTMCETAEGTAVLEFEVSPNAGEVYVRAWDEDCTIDCDCAPIESVRVDKTGEMEGLTIRDDREITLLPGGYIYEVTAKWGNGDSTGGTGTYIFYVHYADEAPDDQ